jgi:hypothetical protein
MIQISQLDFEAIINLFPRKDLRDSILQDTIIMFLCLGKEFQ